jgi:hypothetical protein
MKLLKSGLLLLLFSLNATGQRDIFYWTDTSTAYINHRIVSLVEYNKNVFVLSKSLDVDMDHPHPSFSRVSLQGKVQNFTVYKDVNDIYELNALVVQPNEDLRIYGTSVSNNKFIPYINSVTPNGVITGNSITMVTVPHFVGDAQQINARECVLAKSIQGLATNRYNAFVYRIDMSKNDAITWRAELTSDFNEECSRLVVLPDTSVLLLCKRYTDETSITWIPVIYKLDPKGIVLWNRELSDYAGFTFQNIAADINNIYYSNALGNEQSGSNSGNIIKLDQKGYIVNRVAIDDINPNGILVLKSGKILLYGNEYKHDGVQVVKKGKVILFDDMLSKIKERTLGEMDKPDVELPGLAAAMKPTSSDITNAIQLHDGRVALAGRVFMPLHTGGDEILLSPRTNRNLLIFAGDDGIW